MVKAILKKIIPAGCLNYYHQGLVRYGAWRQHYPSRHLLVIGVTGTKGKSTTSNLIAHVLQQAGFKVGLATTVNFQINDRRWLNTTKMTMLGRTQLQRFLADVVAAQCQYAIVETSSEGIKQFRHLGIDYDAMVFTNLSPEHLEAHGGFEQYKAAKVSWFKYVSQLPTKVLNGQAIAKLAVINGDDAAAPDFFAAAQVPRRYVWSQGVAPVVTPTLLVENLQATSTGLTFTIGGYTMQCPVLGEWNIENIMPAVCLALSQGVALPRIAEALASFPGVPGRMELIDAGQPFTVVVDYAYEPKSLELLYTFWRKRLPQARLITLISSTGGGRDTWRRAVNGQVAGKLCDYVIVTNEDPYDEDPLAIIRAVAAGVEQAGKTLNTTYWTIPDRAQAIVAACQLAQPGDVVFLTAKGAEQKMCVAHGKKIDWDDRQQVRQALQQLA